MESYEHFEEPHRNTDSERLDSMNICNGHKAHHDDYWPIQYTCVGEYMCLVKREIMIHNRLQSSQIMLKYPLYWTYY